jgi:hypothetical protein
MCKWIGVSVGLKATRQKYLTLCEKFFIITSFIWRSKMETGTATIQMKLPAEKYSQLAELLAQRQLIMADILEMALTEWLERETRLHKARQIMHELGEGLDEGQAPHDTARNHDVYLYGKMAS